MRELREALAARGLTCFVDTQSLVAGGPWPQELEDALFSTRCVAVVIGPAGFGPWQRREYQLALNRQVDEERAGRDFQVVPVVLPRAEPPRGFLALNTWIDLRQQGLAAAVEPLARAVRGTTLQSTDARSVDVCPYVGLSYFDLHDTGFFCGREAITGNLAAAVARRPLVALVGASGSGKSSIVRAGLLPQLYAHRPPATVWDAVVLLPGSRPLHYLAQAFLPVLYPGIDVVDALDKADKLEKRLDSSPHGLEDLVEACLSRSRGSQRLLLVVDQLEELFTIAPESARASFLRALLDGLGASSLNILMSIRADYYGDLIGISRELSDLLSTDAAIQNVGPMQPEELAQAIRGPADRVGLTFDDGLVETMVEQVVAQPGSLPLLEHLLQRMWELRRGFRLTWSSYESLGGVRGALVQHAEQTYAAFDATEQQVAKRVLLSLVQPGAGLEDSRRRVPRAELNGAIEKPRVEAVVQKLVDARLVETTAEQPSNEPWIALTHEILIREWPRFRQWLRDERAWLTARLRLSEAMRDWRNAARDDGLLYRGARLAEIEQATPEQRGTLTAPEEEFISASRAQANRDERARFLSMFAQPGAAAVAGGLGYGLAIAVAFNATRQKPDLAVLAFLTEFPFGALVGGLIGLSLTLVPSPGLRRVVLTCSVGACAGALAYLSYALSFAVPAQGPTPLGLYLTYLGLGAVLWTGVLLGATLPRHRRGRLIATLVGGTVSAVVALGFGFDGWAHLIALVESGLAFGGLSGLGLFLTEEPRTSA